MKNFLQDGTIVPMTAPAGGVVSGTAYLIGGVVIAAMQDAAAGATFPALVDGCVSLPKAAALAIAEGALCYWDNTNKVVTSVATGNTLIGLYTEAKAVDATVAVVRLNGTSV